MYTPESPMMLFLRSATSTTRLFAAEIRDADEMHEYESFNNHKT